MEVVERQKEGYESDADMDEGLGDDSDSEDYDSEDGRMFSDSDRYGVYLVVEWTNVV